MKITLALAQIDARLGDVRANLEKHLELARQASQAGANLLIFPELSLTGYYLMDLVPTVAQRPEWEDPVFQPLLQASAVLDLDMVVGFAEVDLRGRYFISGAYLSEGRTVHVHRKLYPPTYGMFDEGRFFAHGETVRAFNTRFGRMGLLICEDFWHASLPYLLWLDGADLLLLTSAGPGRGLRSGERLGTAEWVEGINRAYAGLFTVFVVHANRVGFEDGLHFWGGSTAYDPDGERLAIGAYHREDLVIVEIDLNQLRRTRARLPLLRDERPELVMRELDRILGG